MADSTHSTGAAAARPTVTSGDRPVDRVTCQGSAWQPGAAGLDPTMVGYFIGADPRGYQTGSVSCDQNFNRQTIVTDVVIVAAADLGNAACMALDLQPDRTNPTTTPASSKELVVVCGASASA